MHGKLEFQSTSPVWRTTLFRYNRRRTQIHFNPRPPCGGRPKSIIRTAKKYRYFNPRPPCGGRRRRLNRKTLELYFNPRPPCGGRPPVFEWFRYNSSFQSTSPVWRTTLGYKAYPRRCMDFNPRPPCGGRLTAARYQPTSRRISIHVPRVEDDCAC